MSYHFARTNVPNSSNVRNSVRTSVQSAATKGSMSMPPMSNHPSAQTSTTVSNMPILQPQAPRKVGHPRVVEQAFDSNRMEYIFRYDDGNVKRIAKNVYDARTRSKRDLSKGMKDKKY